MATTCTPQLVGFFFLWAPEMTWSFRQKSPANIGPVSKRDLIPYGATWSSPPPHTRTHTPQMAVCRLAFLHVWMERKKRKIQPYEVCEDQEGAGSSSFCLNVSFVWRSFFTYVGSFSCFDRPLFTYVISFRAVIDFFSHLYVTFLPV